MAKFEGQDRREATLKKVLPEYGLKSLDEARELCLSKGIDVDAIVKGIQPIAFDNASWAYTLGCAIAIKKGIKNAADAAEADLLHQAHPGGDTEVLQCPAGRLHSDDACPGGGADPQF